MHQQQLLGQPGNESALVDEVPIIITAREVDDFLFKSYGGLMEHLMTAYSRAVYVEVLFKLM